MSSHRRRHSNCGCCCDTHSCCNRCQNSCFTGFTNCNCNSNWGCDGGNNQWLLWLLLNNCGFGGFGNNCGFGGFGNNCGRRGFF